ncbi:hypothetical protein B0T16DRAFT_443896 [Cercophora newfieldiana]|uniref:Piwi domain-containing protein n=1 Tax=Cercophora newfieldiana TaxID=92897 RepID=A0AA40CXG5_9PEZI|nr:hypothetical protein B0T16DRAFT_443896 [Cercophora newfieldiana]
MPTNRDVYGEAKSVPPPNPDVTAMEDRLVPANPDLATKMANLSVSDDGRFPTRPAFGTDGKGVTLWANYFEVFLKNVDATLYKYSLTVSRAGGGTQGVSAEDPKLATGRKLERIVRNALNSLGTGVPIASEFKQQVLTMAKLNLPDDGIIKVTLSDTAKPEEWNMGKLREYLRNMDDPEQQQIFPKCPAEIDALNVIIGHTARADFERAVVVGKGRFFATDKGRAETPLPGPITQRAIQILRGYFSSARPATGRLLLNANVTHGVFRNSTVKLSEIFKNMGLNKLGVRGTKFAAYGKELSFANRWLAKARVFVICPGESRESSATITKSIAGLCMTSDGRGRNGESTLPDGKVPPTFSVPPEFKFSSPGFTSFRLDRPKDPASAKLLLPTGLEYGEFCTVADYCKAMQKNPQLIIVVLPHTKAELYNRVKVLGYVEHGIPTLCMQRSKISGDRLLQYWMSVGVKLNLKMGGLNHQLKGDPIPLLKAGDTMVVGYDVTHPTNLAPGAGKNAPSLVGLVARMLDKELVNGFKTRLALWRKHNAIRLPKNLVIFRGGVSEGQFAQVIHHELPNIRQACAETYGKDTPRISLIFSVKRHQTRFYPTSPEGIHKFSHSPKDGTVVDRGVTNAKTWDFFVQAHASLKGTAHPAHYTVLLDEIFRKNYGVKAAHERERLTYYMCFQYGRATKAVSICPPAYYADLVCTRARAHNQRLFEESDTESVLALDGVSLRFDVPFVNCDADIFTIFCPEGIIKAFRDVLAGLDRSRIRHVALEEEFLESLKPMSGHLPKGYHQKQNNAWKLDDTATVDSLQSNSSDLTDVLWSFSLPTELCLMIWERVPQPRRLVGIISNPSKRPSNTFIAQPRHLQAPFPPLHACRESRAVWLRRYSATPQHLTGTRGGISLRFEVPFVDYDADIFTLFRPLPHPDVPPDSDDDESLFDPFAGLNRARIRNVAVGEEAEMVGFSAVALGIRSLPNLEVLWILSYGPWPGLHHQGGSGADYEITPEGSLQMECGILDVPERAVAEHRLFGGPERFKHLHFAPRPHVRPLRCFRKMLQAWLWHAENSTLALTGDVGRQDLFVFEDFVLGGETGVGSDPSARCPLTGISGCGPSGHTLGEMTAWVLTFKVRHIMLYIKSGWVQEGIFDSD